MKHRSKAIALILVLAATGTICQAMSEFTALTITPLWPTNSNPGNVVLYGVTVDRLGSGMLSVDFSSTGLPEGSAVSFAYDPARFTGNKPNSMYFVMAVTTTEPTQTDAFAFVVTGAARRETIAATNTIQRFSKDHAATPQLIALELQPAGAVKLRGMGFTGESYRIEAAVDLGDPNWTVVGETTADGNGRFTFIQSGASARGFPMRFYRAVQVNAPAP